MSSDDAAFICGIVIGIVVGIVAGITIENHTWKSNAKEAGKLEYYIDKNDDKKWRWK